MLQRLKNLNAQFANRQILPNEKKIFISVTQTKYQNALHIAQDNRQQHF